MEAGEVTSKALAFSNPDEKVKRFFMERLASALQNSFK